MNSCEGFSSYYTQIAKAINYCLLCKYLGHLYQTLKKTIPTDPRHVAQHGLSAYNQLHDYVQKMQKITEGIQNAITTATEWIGATPDNLTDLLDQLEN